MSLKSNKGSKTTGKRVVKTARPWPDLPQQLVRLIGRESTLMQSITSFGGITKSWTSTPKKCNQTSKSKWPHLSQNGEGSHEKPKEFIIVFHEEGYWSWYYKRKYPLHGQYNWEYLVGCSHGALVAKMVKSNEYIIWAPETGYHPITLPSWDKDVPFMFVTLSYRSIDRGDYVVMVLTGITSPAFVFFRGLSRGKEGETKWVRQENTMVDPYGSNQNSMQFSNAIGFEGKFYALSLQGALVVIEDLNDSHELTVTALSKHRAVPSVSCTHFRELLVESCGEILLVFFISTKKCNVVDHVEVFRLNILELSWVKIEKLRDDRILFVGANCCMSVNASKVGCRKNCIYFTQLSEEGWWVYDMETNCIIPSGMGEADLTWDAQVIE